MAKSATRSAASRRPVLAPAGRGLRSCRRQPGGLVISAEKATLDTTHTDQFTARLASGAPASVKWTIAGGQNDASLGQGTISANGSYTPPPLLSRDQVQVQVMATSRTIPRSRRLTPSPSPRDLSRCLPRRPPASRPAARFRSGERSLKSTPGRSTGRCLPLRRVRPILATAYGSVGETRCHHSSRSYTYCTATYTAPRGLPPGSPSVFLVGQAAGNPHSAAALHILLNGAGFNSSGLQNQAVQTGYVQMGSSGGNANDYDSRKDGGGKEYVNDCCGGTLGALVTDRNGNPYILSNNHVLAESDQARAGDTVVQPALVDLNCNPQAGRSVGLAALRGAAPEQLRPTWMRRWPQRRPQSTEPGRSCSWGRRSTAC